MTGRLTMVETTESLGTSFSREVSYIRLSASSLVLYIIIEKVITMWKTCTAQIVI